MFTSGPQPHNLPQISFSHFILMQLSVWTIFIFIWLIIVLFSSLLTHLTHPYLLSPHLIFHNSESSYSFYTYLPLCLLLGYGLRTGPALNMYVYKHLVSAIGIPQTWNQLGSRHCLSPLQQPWGCSCWLLNHHSQSLRVKGWNQEAWLVRNPKWTNMIRDTWPELQRWHLQLIFWSIAHMLTDRAPNYSRLTPLEDKQWKVTMGEQTPVRVWHGSPFLWDQSSCGRKKRRIPLWYIHLSILLPIHTKFLTGNSNQTSERLWPSGECGIHQRGHHRNSLVVSHTAAEDYLKCNLASDQDHAFRTVAPPHWPTCFHT